MMQRVIGNVRREIIVFLLLFLCCCWMAHGLSTLPIRLGQNDRRFYFAYGSNMYPTTMTSLRNVKPLSSTAAILPNYRLCFDLPGIEWMEPSAASVEQCPNSVVHGVLYELSLDDFARVGQTEGSAYRWTKCHVYSYIGDNDRAGEKAAILQKSVVECYTLTKNFNVPSGGLHIPTSPSYLQIIQKGAAYWNMDRSYQISLSKITTNDRLVIRDGLSGSLLRIAEIMNPPSSMSS